MRLLDLYAGRLGWSREFLKRGWTVVAVDLVRPPEIPDGVEFIQADVMECSVWSHHGSRSIAIGSRHWDFDFACASSPCEQFSVWGMKHFHPNPKYPELGLKLFNHTRALLEASGLDYVMENVRSAQKFVGEAQGHAGSFYLWGNAVPSALPTCVKGLDMRRDPITGKRTLLLGRRSSHNSKMRSADKALTATIPPELASCVAIHAGRVLSGEYVRPEQCALELQA